MALFNGIRDESMVMGLSSSIGHGDWDTMMSFLTNPWLSLSQFWISTKMGNAILAVRVLFPLHRGVIVRAMMMLFIHGVFLGMPSFLSLVVIIAVSALLQICSLRRIWNPGITSEAFIVKISNVLGAKCLIGWDYTGIKPNSLMRTMTLIRTNWYQNVRISKLIPGATDFSYVMWSFKQRMSIRHTYHVRVKWLLKKEHIMFNNMIASKAFRMEASSNSLLRLCHFHRMAHISAYVIKCVLKFCIGFVPVVITTV